MRGEQMARACADDHYNQHLDNPQLLRCCRPLRLGYYDASDMTTSEQDLGRHLVKWVAFRCHDRRIKRILSDKIWLAARINCCMSWREICVNQSVADFQYVKLLYLLLVRQQQRRWKLASTIRLLWQHGSNWCGEKRSQLLTIRWCVCYQFHLWDSTCWSIVCFKRLAGKNLKSLSAADSPCVLVQLVVIRKSLNPHCHSNFEFEKHDIWLEHVIYVAFASCSRSEEHTSELQSL